MGRPKCAKPEHFLLGRSADGRYCIGCHREAGKRNREKHPESHQKYRDSRLEEKKAYDAEYSKVHAPKKRNATSKWQKEDRNKGKRAVTSRRYTLRKRGWTQEQYDKAFAEQKGLCSICKREVIGRTMDADHDHTTGKRRDLLCNTCNTGLGMFRDNPEFLEAAASYIKKHRSV